MKSSSVHVTAASIAVFFAVGCVDGDDTLGDEDTAAIVATKRFVPVADAKLSAGAASTNFGTTTDLVADYQLPRQMSLMNFNIQGLSGYVASARLRLYAVKSTLGSVRILPCGTNWAENTVTWANRPTIDSVRTLGDNDNAEASGVWLEFKLTFGTIKGNGLYCFALDQTGINSFTVGSRESATKPELIIDVSDTPVAPPPAVVYPTVPTAPSAPAIPSGYTAVYARNKGAKCDGRSDDSVALQNAINGLAAYQALVLPNANCVTSNALYIRNKSNIALIGYGQKYTFIRATNKYYSAIAIYDSSNILIQGLENHGVNTTTRLNTYDTVRGIVAHASAGLTVNDVKIFNVSGAGLLFCHAVDSVVKNSEVNSSWADAFHVTCGSNNITFQNNRAIRPGDDCFASIGYGTGYNRNISFMDNYCFGNNRVDNVRHAGGGSGVAFDGTLGGKAYRNYSERSGVAGIRIESMLNWNTGSSQQIDAQNNTFVHSRVNSEVPHPVVFIKANKENVDNVIFSNNTIQDPLTTRGIEVSGTASSSGNVIVSNATIKNNRMIDSNNTMTKCVGVNSTTTSNIVVSGNTKNGVACNN